MTEQKVILLIEDEADLVVMSRGLLTRKGYRVVTASNGKEGLEKLAEITPHLIILDINMPEMDGATFYEHIYDHANKKAKYPVMVVTARAHLGELFAKLDVDGFMTKPFELDQYLHEIEIIMSKRYGSPGDFASEKQNSQSPRKPVRKVLVIEDDQTAFDRIVLAFVNRGYDLAAAKTGVDGIEYAMENPPDMVLIKLGLPDLPGDVVALKLRKMPKTMDIPLLLYRPFDMRSVYTVEKQICDKIGIDKLVESDEPNALLSELEKLTGRCPQG